MSPLQKAIKTSVIEGKNYKQEINTFLRNYRACPHPSTGISPAEIMFNRPMKTLLPQFSVKRPDKRIRKRDAKVKLKRKLYSDKEFGAKQSKSKPGDSVLVKQPKKNKLTQKKGSMVTVGHGNRTLTRDASHVKPISMKHAHAPNRIILKTRSEVKVTWTPNVMWHSFISRCIYTLNLEFLSQRI